MALSKTDICNKSLTLLGASPITSISDDTRQARSLNRVYEAALRSILSEDLWSFATKRKLLNTVDTDVDWYHTSENEGYIYQIPADCIRVFSTNDSAATWRIEGQYILSDTSGLGIKYVHYLDAPFQYTASFIEAFSDKLASDIAFTLLNDTNKATSMLQKYEGVSLPKAMAENAQPGEGYALKDDAWTKSKNEDGTESA